MFQLVNGFSDLSHVHVGEQSDHVAFLIFVVGVDRNDNNVGDQKYEEVETQQNQDAIKVEFLDIQNSLYLFVLKITEYLEHRSVIVPQILNVLLAFVHQHVKVTVQKLRQRNH